jgi:hypothetical protein
MEARIITFSPYRFGSRLGDMGPNKLWRKFGLGTEVSLKPLAPPREVRPSSLVAGKRWGVGSFDGRV